MRTNMVASYSVNFTELCLLRNTYLTTLGLVTHYVSLKVQVIAGRRICKEIWIKIRTFHENTYENVFNKVVANLFRYQCVKIRISSLWGIEQGEAEIILYILHAEMGSGDCNRKCHFDEIFVTDCIRSCQFAMKKFSLKWRNFRFSAVCPNKFASPHWYHAKRPSAKYYCYYH